MRDWVLQQPLWKQKLVSIGMLFGAFALAICAMILPLAVLAGPMVWWTLLPLGLLFVACSIWMLRWQESPDTEDKAE